MNNFTLIVKSLGLLLLIVLSGLCNNPVSAQFPGSSDIDDILSAAAKRSNRSDLMIIKDGEVVYNRSFGKNWQSVANKEKIGSASKWLVAATMLTLVDKGYIALNDSIGKFLPKFQGAKANITLRQLLSHTSGFPADCSYLKDEKLSLAKSVDSIALHVNLVAKPGSQFIYGNVSYQIAARLAEMVTGKDWESLFKEKIATPCKMINTDFGNEPHKEIGEGAFSTIDDYSNFLVMILNKGIFQGLRIISARSIYEMIKDQTSALPLGATPYRFVYAKQSKFYGLGVWLDRVMPNDSTATEISCQGENGFTPWVNFCKHIAGVYSFNINIGEINSFVEDSKKIIDRVFSDNCNDMLIERDYQKTALNYPSSFINRDNINFKLDSEAKVKLKLFDSLGNEILVLMDGKMKPGEYTVPVDSLRLNSGIYFYHLEVNDKTETKKFTIRN